MYNQTHTHTHSPCVKIAPIKGVSCEYASQTASQTHTKAIKHVCTPTTLAPAAPTTLVYLAGLEKRVSSAAYRCGPEQLDEYFTSALCNGNTRTGAAAREQFGVVLREVGAAVTSSWGGGEGGIKFMIRDELCQMDYIIYRAHRANTHTQRGSYDQFRPSPPDGDFLSKSDSCSSPFKMDFICFIQRCTRVARRRGGDPGGSSSERTGLYCSLESGLLAPCCDSSLQLDGASHSR